MGRKKIGIDVLIYSLYAVLIPFNMILNFTGSTINKQVGLMTGILLLLICLFQHRYILWAEAIVPELLFLGYIFLSCIWSINVESSISGFITLASLIFLYMAGILRRFNKKELLFIFGTMIVSCMIIPLLLTGNNAISISRGTLVSSAGTADQNSLAANMAFAACIAYAMLFSSRKIYLRILSGIAFFLIIAGIISTGSRGATLTIIIALIYYTIKTMPELKESKVFWIIVCVLVIGIFVFLNYVQNNMSEALLSRFSISSLREDQGSGRAILWENFLEIAFKNPVRLLFGYGYGASSSIYRRFFLSARVPHNVYIQMLVEVGIIGSVFFLYMLYSIWRILERGNSALAKALFFIVIFEFMTLGFLDNKGTWNVFLLSVLLALNKIDSMVDLSGNVMEV